MSTAKIPYQFKLSRRAKNLRIAVYESSRVVVTVPWFLGLDRARQFIEQKSEWIRNKLEYFRAHKPSIVPNSGRRGYLKFKQQALHLALQKVEQWNKFYDFRYNRINIKNQKTRWGSCSKKGNLNFNYKIVYLPEDLLNYLVVHELCHLKEFNHSRKFWALVSKALPDYKSLRKLLRNI